MSVSEQELEALRSQLEVCRQRQENVNAFMASIHVNGEDLKIQIETLITQAAGKATQGEPPDMELLELGGALSRHAALKLFADKMEDVYIPIMEAEYAGIVARVNGILQQWEHEQLPERRETWRLFRKGLMDRPVGDATGKVPFLCETCEQLIGVVNTAKLAAEGLVATAFRTGEGRPLFKAARRWQDWYCKDCGERPIRDAGWVLKANYEYLPVGPQAQAGISTGSQPTIPVPEPQGDALGALHLQVAGIDRVDVDARC